MNSLKVTFLNESELMCWRTFKLFQILQFIIITNPSAWAGYDTRSIF